MLEIRRPTLPPGFCLLVVLLLSLAAAADAQPVLRVPADVGDLGSAIDQVANGGIIELAAGTYPAPGNGFRIRFEGKSFTIRAAAGAQVILSGEGGHTILLIEDSAPERPIVLENLIFEDGRGSREGEAGAVTVRGAETVFRGCTFRDNRGPAPPGVTTGGGGVRVVGGAVGRFEDCVFEDNRVETRGGALEVIASTAIVRRNRFTGNRAEINGAVPGAPRTVVGGALYALDSRVRVERSRFEDNRASWVGGALYAFGTWTEPEVVPAADVTVVHSTFVDNRVRNESGVPVPIGVSAGGAIHVEDQTTLRVFSSRFEDNRGQWAGAINVYRARVEVHDSVFRGNRGDLSEDFGPPAAGGAITLTSSDFSDPSTEFGAINRRSSELQVTGSFFQGRRGTAGATAQQGGCLFADGDRSRLTGSGVPPDGGLEENRTRVEIRDSVFFDCDVDVAPGSSTNNSRGGAIFVSLTDLLLTGSLVLGSDALDDDGLGGALSILGRSRAVIEGSTFADNSAGSSGGALHVAGGELQVDGCNFFDNEVSPGVPEPFQTSNGAAIFSIPELGDDGSGFSRDVTGRVANSLFTANVGLALREADLTTGPINDLRYDGNRFFETTFGNDVFLNGLAFGDRTVAELNNLVINRANGTSTDKSRVANQQLGGAPDAGQAVAAPSAVFTAAVPGDPAPPTPAFVGYAWRGTAATLGGAALPDRAGVLEVGAAGRNPLRVDGVELDDAPVAERSGLVACKGGAESMCLNDGRFQVEVDFRTGRGRTGLGQVAPFGTVDSGIFFFFNPNNLEMLVKVLDNCAGPTNRFWVFAAATTDVQYTLRVTDALTGDSRTYFNPLGVSSPAIADTNAFATCDASPANARSAPRPEIPAGMSRTGGRVQGAGSCVPGPTNLCLRQDRFEVTVDFRPRNGTTGPAQSVSNAGTSDSGLFFFFNPDNWEVLVKVLDNCNGPTNRFWVFAAATTTLEYTLRVTDVETGEFKEYFNPLGNRADAITDTDAFATCP